MNKTVYIVTYESRGYDSYKTIDGVFSTEDAAYAYINKHDHLRGDFDVETWEVDKVDG